MTLKAQLRSCVFRPLEVYAFRCVSQFFFFFFFFFFMYYKSYFLYDLVILRFYLVGVLDINLDGRVDERSDCLGFHLSLLLRRALC